MTRRSLEIPYHGHRLGVELTETGDLVLRLDGVERKRRSCDGTRCAYVWTNVELHWEAHHYIEARFWPEADRLVVTANGTVVREDPSAD